MKHNEQFLKSLAQQLDIDDRFIAACDHHYDCRCEFCLGWWMKMGPERDGEDETWGPFSAEEIADARDECNADAPHPGDLICIGYDTSDDPIFVPFQPDLSNILMGYDNNGHPILHSL